MTSPGGGRFTVRAEVDLDALEQVMAAMRSAGWRGSEDRLRVSALKRLATARHHRELAAERRGEAHAPQDRDPEIRRWYAEQELRHEVRAAALLGQITRAERNVALQLVPSWTAGVEDLLAAARAVLS